MRKVFLHDEIATILARQANSVAPAIHEEPSLRHRESDTPTADTTASDDTTPTP